MSKTCSFEGCERKHYSKGLCVGHYQQQRRGEELRPLRKRISKAEVERLRAQGLKKCCDCDQIKPLEDFAKDKHSKDGRYHQCKACEAEYREANREKRLEYKRQYYQANREKYRENLRQWRQANPDKARANAALRRALKRQAAAEPFTVEDVKRIWGESPICVYCQERPAEHLDHFMPLALGGEHSLRNATWPACAPCNLRKQDKHPWEWMLELMAEEEQIAFVAALKARMNKETA